MPKIHQTSSRTSLPKLPHRRRILDRERKRPNATGWNHFELREYDGRIGRWTNPDPKRQFANPYIAYGNNPINIIDPDGGFSGPTPKTIMSSFAKALFISAEKLAEYSYQYKFAGSTDSNLAVESINLKTHVNNTLIGDVTFDLNGKSFEAQVRWFGNSNEILSAKFTKHGGQNNSNVLVFSGGPGGVVGKVHFESEADFLQVQKTYTNYVNNLIQSKIEGASIEVANTEARREEWIKHYQEKGVTENFEITNIQDKPGLWETFKSWLLGDDN